MLTLLISIAGILITILFVIGTHEFAHFVVARLLGVKVLRFSIGFGKTLFRWFDKKGTEYVLALIPLGGYVKMLDETEGNVLPAELPFAFNRQPFYKKFLIVLAGPLTNIICALILYWLIFMIGFMALKPIIGEVTPRSIAAESHLQANQVIISIDNKKTATWMSVVFRLLAHVGDQDYLNLEVKNQREDKTNIHMLNLANWQMDALNPDPLSSLGITPYEPNIPLVIGKIADHSPASSSALQVGDKILALANKPIKDWQELMTLIAQSPDKTILFKVERNGKTLQFPVTLGEQRNVLLQKSGYLGIGPHFVWPKELLHKIQYDPVTALAQAWQQIIDFTYFNLLLFGKLFTGKLSLQSLGGPITIFSVAGSALNSGMIPFLSMLAFLSISIGIINFLPIPGLDGGHLFIQIVEFIIRRPVPEKVLSVLYRIGFAIIIFIFIQALVNDILRL